MSGPGTFFGIEIARRGLMAHQKSLEITGHNIANANTPGYSRQQAVHQTGIPYTAPGMNSGTGPGQLGSGVVIEQIRRIRNEYLDHQARDISSGFGYWKSQYDIAKQVELAFPEPDGRGLQDVMIDFFNDWQKLNNTPEDPGVKTAVLESGEELCNQFRQTFNQLDILLNSIAKFDNSNNLAGGMLAGQLDQVNNIVAEISELNTSIAKIIDSGRQPNDLLDKRDMLLEQLSEFGPVEVSPAGREMVSIKIYGIKVLGNDNVQYNLSAALNGDDDIEIENTDGGSFKLEDSRQGSLASLEKTRQQILGHIGDLDILAKTLADKVNDTHNGEDNKGEDFFKITDAVHPAQSLEVNLTAKEIDSNQALDIARLRSENWGELDGMTFEAKYSELVSKVGTNCKTAENRLTNQEAISNQIENIRQSAAGVSIDEELTLLIQFQYGFQASSRVINAMDEMLDVVINRLF